MSEVEITNVGGPRPRDGVASEATLAALLAAIERNGTGSSRAQTSARIQEQYNRSVRSGTRDQGLFGKAVTATTRAVTDFGKELATGGNRASDFSEALFGSTSVITKFINYLDSTVDIFRDLTSVGASFNNSITQMIAASAASSMNLSDFAQMVRNNSESFASFGGTVTSGAKVFGDFSKQFRNTTGRALFEMGFSIADINEGLVGFFEIERMRSGQAIRLDRSRNQVANEYILQLDKLAKITGRQRKEIEQALQRQLQDAGIRNQINRLSGQEQQNLQETLAFLDTELPGYSDALRDLMDGVAQGAGRALSNQVPGMTDFMQEVYAGRVGLTEFIDVMTGTVLPTLESASANTNKEVLDAMRERGGIVGEMASLYDNLYQLNRLSGRDYQLALDEQRERADLINRTLGPFEQSIIDLRKSIVDSFFEIGGASGGVFDAFLELGEAIRELFLPGVSGSLPSIGEKLKDFIGFLVGPEGILTKGIRTFTRFLRSDNFSTFMDGVKTKISEFTTYLGNIFYNEEGKLDIFNGVKTLIIDIFERIKDFIFGKEVSNYEGPELITQREGGLLNLIKDLFEGQGTGTFLDDIYQSVKTSLFGGTTASGNQQTGLLTDAYEWLKLTLFGGTTESGTQQTGLLTDAYNWLVDTLFGTKPEGSDERSGGLLETAYNWLVDKLFPADQPNMRMWDRIKDTIMDVLFGENVNTRADGLGEEIRKGGILDSIANGFSNLFNNQEVVNSITNGFTGILTAAENAIQNFIGLPTEGSLYEQLLNKVGLTSQSNESIISQIGNKIYDEMFGKVVGYRRDTGEEIRDGGIVDSVSNFISTMLNEQLSTINAFVNENLEKFDTWIADQISSVEEKLREFLGMSPGQSFGNFISQVVAQIEISISRVLQQIPGFGDAGRTGEANAIAKLANAQLEAAAAESSATGNISPRSTVGHDVATQISEAEMRAAAEKRGWYNPASWFGDDLTAEGQRQRAIAEALRAQMEGDQNANAFGTNGFQNFGRKTYATLHGVEAVVPRNSEAGEVLQAFFDAQNATANTAQTSMQPVSRSQDQTTLLRKLDELNTTMNKVAEYLEEGLGIQNKTMRGIRNFSGDYMRGVGR